MYDNRPPLLGREGAGCARLPQAGVRRWCCSPGNGILVSRLCSSARRALLEPDACQCRQKHRVSWRADVKLVATLDLSR